MKKILVTLLCLAMPCLLMSQEIPKTKKQKEAGVVFYDLDNFGLTFRIGSEKWLWRFNTLYVGGTNIEEIDDSAIIKENGKGFGIRVGREYRKDIAANLALRLGADLSFSYSQSKYDYNDTTVNDYDILQEQTTYVPGINLVIGLNYTLNDNIVIGAELLPGFTYGTGTSSSVTNGDEVKSDISVIQYGLSNNSVLISLAYRFK